MVFVLLPHLAGVETRPSVFIFSPNSGILNCGNDSSISVRLASNHLDNIRWNPSSSTSLSKVKPGGSVTISNRSPLARGNRLNKIGDPNIALKSKCIMKLISMQGLSTLSVTKSGPKESGFEPFPENGSRCLAEGKNQVCSNLFDW